MTRTAPPARHDPFDRDVIALFGLPFDLGGIEAAAARVTAAVAAQERLFLSTVNLDWLVQARRDADFRASALASDWVTMDGVPVVELARLAGVEGPEKVAGSDLFDRLKSERLGVFFFGGRTGAAEAAAAALNAAGGPMHAVGWQDPGHGDVASMSTEAHLSPIRAAAPDLLVVSLGARKGQAWLMTNAGELAVPVVSHLGAVVDFTAGTVSRAPRFMQVGGFEWAWRIGQDPALWRRYKDDFGALPALVRGAVTLRRLVGKLAADAAEGTVDVERNGTRTTLRLRGRLTAEALRPILRRAVAEADQCRIVLERGAAPDLRALGQLMIAESIRERRGTPFSIEPEAPDIVNLVSLTLRT
ncbi:WecB/TagA/CpsF family glycosyltransferase [Parvularcula dongshanensis]|uniref:N-acetylglucosaminyldiphosphoundecaprenol N-acetyl-beta-D-mannosaminyltransferase n=1 Tax=Parvularcula dongshanensis TaxID=1173995 RepID=A0A840I119_9PROT|nr:WecB/TagA/CpsF family glycosyltransferase [Parvularcula dongshanensis]MBB4658045.1 N-acetylglucosaminyldiphosphoundecaprenol N-acetyl-beta-D-mannosaminyltransferase [Parvularcula dongshanensis]